MLPPPILSTRKKIPWSSLSFHSHMIVPLKASCDMLIAPFLWLCTVDKSISDALNARRAKILKSVSYSRAINHEEISPFRKDKAGSRDIVGDNSL